MVKALAHPELRNHCHPMIIGNMRLLRDYLQALPLSGTRISGNALIIDDTEIPIIEILSDACSPLAASILSRGSSPGSIVRGVELTLAGEADALVTMPISKRALHAGGYDFPGHTEMIASLTGGTPMMVLRPKGCASRWPPSTFRCERFPI